MIVSEEKIREIKNRFEIVGNSPYLNRAIEKALKVAPTDITVLISGESGVGKEAFSKIIHHLSRRKHGAFIAINCASIPEGTIDSELFGHEKGSFTNAYEARKGYFETVNGGSIFLDEISELPMETQARLLRVLETGEYIRVGSSKVQKTDVRLIAASNKNLLELTEKNKFREDLYYRLSTINIQIPPLRKRADDIEYLFAKFADDFVVKYKTPLIELAPDALEMLKTLPWPGNVRQLKNLVEQISILETERYITLSILKSFLPEMTGKELIPYEGRKTTFSNSEERDLLYKFLIDIKKEVSEVRVLMYDVLSNQEMKGDEMQGHTSYPGQYVKTGKMLPETPYKSMDKLNDEQSQYEESAIVSDINESLSILDKEKELIKEALIKYKGRRKPASKELGISERTLYRKIKEYDLESL